MDSFLPNEEEFEIMLAALISHEKQLQAEEIAALAVKSLPKNLTDEKAFEIAFSKGVDYGKLKSACMINRDKLIMLSAKIILLRDHLRKEKLNNEVNELTK